MERIFGDSHRMSDITKGAKAWQNPEYREKCRGWQRKRYANNEEFHKEKIQASRDYRKARAADPAWRAAQVERTRAWKEAKKAAKAQLAQPECAP